MFFIYAGGQKFRKNQAIVSEILIKLYLSLFHVLKQNFIFKNTKNWTWKHSKDQKNKKFSKRFFKNEKYKVYHIVVQLVQHILLVIYGQLNFYQPFIKNYLLSMSRKPKNIELLKFCILGKLNIPKRSISIWNVCKGSGRSKTWPCNPECSNFCSK